MATINGWNNQVLAANVTFNGGTMSLGTDSTDNAINIGTAASAGRTVTVGNATGTSTIAINCGTGGVTVGTSATAHASTFGSTNSTSATTVQSGSGALNVTATNGALTINSGTGALGISTDASATTVNVATGAAVKTATFGSTNTTSATVISSGSGNIVHNTGLTVDSTGRNKNTVQPAFLAYAASSQTNVTGDGTNYTATFTTEVFDQNNNFDGTSTFTAPITGRYWFGTEIVVGDVIATNALFVTIVATGATYTVTYTTTATHSGGFFGVNVGAFVSMTASDTCVIKVAVGGVSKVVDVVGAAAPPYYSAFYGYLVC